MAHKPPQFRYPARILNKVLKEIGAHGTAIDVRFAPLPEDGPAQRAERRREYDGLKSLPFMNEYQAMRYRYLREQVVKDNRQAMREDMARREACTS